MCIRDRALAARATTPPKPSIDHSRKRIVDGVETPNPLPVIRKDLAAMPSKACDEDPLAGFWAASSGKGG